MKKALLFAVVVLGAARIASAIPAFARKYGYSCEVCHAPVPHLKAFGEEFMAAGYRIPDKEPPRATVDTGDPTLLLQRELPLALRLDAFVAYEPKAGVASDFRTPVAAKIASGGNISERLSYYTYFLMTEDSKIVGLEDAYLYGHDLFGLPLTVVFGQYRVSDPIKPTETRLTFENYALFKFRVGDSRINLSYDRGIMAGYAFPFGLDLSMQVTNGNGIDQQEIFDQDKYKSLVGRAAQSFAKGNIRFGLTGYRGTEAGAGGALNTVTYVGPDVRLRTKVFDVLIGYMRREDTNPLFGETGMTVRSDAYLVEAIVGPWGEKGKTFFTFAWNRVNSGLDVSDYHTLTINVGRLLRRNVRWLAEYTRDLIAKRDRFLTGIVTAF